MFEQTDTFLESCDRKIDSLVKPTLRRLGISNLADLARIDLRELGKQPGVGSTKIKIIRELVLWARNQVRESSKHPVPKLGNYHVDAELIFVAPGLARCFDRAGIRTVRDLLSFDEAVLAFQNNWTSHRSSQFRALRRFYWLLSSGDSQIKLDTRITSVIAKSLLPDPTLGGLTVEDFLTISAEFLALTPARKTAFESIKSCLVVFVPRICDISHLPNRGAKWRELALFPSDRAVSLLEGRKIETLEQLRKFVVAPQPDARKFLETDRIRGAHLMNELRCKLAALVLSGIRDLPSTSTELAELALTLLSPRQKKVVRLRSEGLTLDRIATREGKTRQWADHWETQAQERLSCLRRFAQPILAELDVRLQSDLVIALTEAFNLAGASKRWHLALTAQVAGKTYGINADEVSWFTDREVTEIRQLCRDAIYKLRYEVDDHGTSLSDLLRFVDRKEGQCSKQCRKLVARKDRRLTKPQLRVLLGTQWLRRYLVHEFVAAGMSGLEFSDSNILGLIETPHELLKVLPGEIEMIGDGRVRRWNKCHASRGEITEVLRSSDRPLTARELADCSGHNSPASEIYRCLTPSLDIVATHHGQYTHIEKLNLSRADVTAISRWGASLLASYPDGLDGDELLEHFKQAKLDYPTLNQWQLASIVAKHPDVRRPSSGLRLVYRASQYRGRCPAHESRD